MSIDPKASARRIIDWNQRAAGSAALNVVVTAKFVADAVEVARALLAGEGQRDLTLTGKRKSK